MKRVASVFYAVIAISVGVLVLLGYFIPQIAPFQRLLLEWAVILSGFALLVGLGNLFSVHFARVRARQKGYLYSLVTLVSMLSVLFLGVAGIESATNFVVNAIVVPVEISLMAVLAVTLVYASIRLLRDRLDLKSIFFILTALFVLAGMVSLPFLAGIPILGDGTLPVFSQIISQVAAVGGARGLLIGIALGTLTTGLRVLFGADRPYGGK
ncbi:MAG: hypothetical protein RBS68_14490 [Anaerolineales bacterium]|nr:hypothetical protein [Anaerolineales bacterium]